MRDYNFWSAQDFNKLIQECNKYTDRKQRISWSNVQKLFPNKTKDQIKSQYFNFKNNIKIQGKESKYKRIATEISQDSITSSISEDANHLYQSQGMKKQMLQQNDICIKFQFNDQQQARDYIWP